VLTTPGHDRVIYNVTGPSAVTYHDIARELSALSERPVRYIPLSAEEARRGLTSAGLPTPLVELFVAIDLAIKSGAFAVASSDVADLTGKAPAGLAEVFAEYRTALLAPVTGVS
jgi:uncharacterized protein YbjT (DUF2867 family)